MHELRTALSPHPKSSDPEEQRLRDLWYEAKRALEIDGNPDTGNSRFAFNHIDSQLTTYLWDRAVQLREDDRKKHPKAKRNLPVPPKTPEPYEGLPT